MVATSNHLGLHSAPQATRSTPEKTRLIFRQGHGNFFFYKVCVGVSKVLRTGTTVYIAVVVARSNGPNRPNCEVRVLLRGIAATVWKRAKTSPRTLVRTDLAVSPWQHPLSHLCPPPAVSGQTQNYCHPPPTVLPWFDTLWLLPIFKNEIEAERTPIWYHWGDPGQIAESTWYSDRKGTPGSVPKVKETMGPVSTYWRELLRGWWRPIGLMVRFMIFTPSVQNILDKP
jgi:hypothetical protein